MQKQVNHYDTNEKEPNHIIGSAQVYGRASFQNITYMGHFKNGPCTSMHVVVGPFTDAQIKTCINGAAS